VIAAAIRGGRWELRIFGTSLDLAYLAAGRVAGVWHFSRIPPLHFAAGTLLAAEAGAVVTDDRGEAWTPDSTSMVAAATPALHEALLALLPT
jgi:myo-inositol-1(or 4)-monophosphatase